MAERQNDSSREKDPSTLDTEPIFKSADLEPIRMVERELTRPDGSTVVVEVPVYPPFRLETKDEPKSPARGGKRR